MYDLSKQYNHNDFKNFLSNFLPDDFILNIKNYKLNNFPFFEDAKLLGAVNSLNNLKVLEIELNTTGNNRVAVSRDVFRFLSSYNIENALVLTYSKQEYYRLSFIKSSLNWESDIRVKRVFSNPKKLSFLLGPMAKVHTPYAKLIREGKIKDLNDLSFRFDAEVISEEFFSNYKKLYERLLNFLSKDKKTVFLLKKNLLNNQVFATKIMGQVLFTYFIQKKNWLGANKDEKLYKGDRNFIRNSFNKFETRNNFYNEFLEYLFYEGFNKKNDDNYLRELDCKIPFLNGGLFAPLRGYNWKKENLNIPNEIFSNANKDGILDIFDLYNFTVNETDPLDKEVGIDPEMLGKVFERLIDVNGVVYTPKPVVSYMCEQLIKEYLLNNQEEINLNKDQIDNLLNSTNIEKNSELFKDLLPTFKILDLKLKEIKVIDPAVGSGQFATGMMSLICEIRQKLNIFFKYDRNLFQLKKNCIQNSIYGVDIIASSIEITKLRLWLALIVDENKVENISALPNLDYKIYQCDSLIKTEVNLLSKNNLDQFNLLKNQLYVETDDLKIEDLKNNITKKLDEILIENNEIGIEIIFNEIFECKTPGFDIVLGNPPYISAVDQKRSETTKTYYKKTYPEATGFYDEFILFLLRGIYLLKKNGVYSWIIKNSFLNSDYSLRTKKKLLESGGLHTCIDISKVDVFHKVGVYPIIITGNLFNKENNIFREYEVSSLENLEIKLFNKIAKSKKYPTLKEFNIKLFSGTTGFIANDIIKLLKENKSSDSIPFLVSGNVDRYKYNNKNVTYLKNKLKNAYIRVVGQNILAEQKINFFNNPKIVIAGMTKKIEAVYIKEPIGLGVGIYGIYYFNNYDPYFLTGILNSKFYSNYLITAFKDKHLQGGYISINKSVIEKLPFKIFKISDQNFIAERSKKLHKLYQDFDENNDVINNLESQINNKVETIFN